MKLMIFHLPLQTSPHEVRRLLQSCGLPAGMSDDVEVGIHAIPGAIDEVFAVVNHMPDGLRALHLPDALNRRRPGRRNLWSWVTSMP